jgi:hypothetical protein
VEISFAAHTLLRALGDQPELMAIWTGFGPLLMILALPVSKLLRATKLVWLERLDTAYYLALTLTWIIGFVVTMLLIFFADGITPIRIALIWLSMFVVYFVFSFIYYAPIKRWMSSITANKGDHDAQAQTAAGIEGSLRTKRSGSKRRTR